MRSLPVGSSVVDPAGPDSTTPLLAPLKTRRVNDGPEEDGGWDAGCEGIKLKYYWKAALFQVVLLLFTIHGKIVPTIGDLKDLQQQYLSATHILLPTHWFEFGFRV